MKKLMLLLMVVLLVGTVSAIDWDNKLTYSNEDLKVDFENLWGLPLIGSYLGSAELKSHPSVDYIKKVGVGNQIVMWYDFDFKDLYKNGLGDVEFTDQKTGEKINRVYSFVYWGDKERDIYGQGECFLNISGGQTCDSIIIRTETYQDWIPYDSKDIPKGKVRIGIKVEVKTDDYVDGIWTIIGKKVSRHSVWDANLDINLISYYKLDLGSGVVLDSLGVNNGTNNGATRGVTGKIGNAFRFDNTTNDSVSSGFSDVLGNNFTISLWYNSSTNPFSSNTLIERATAIGDFTNRELMRMNTDGSVNFQTHNNNGSEDMSITTSDDIADGNYHHIVFVRNSTEARIYINGSVAASVIKNYAASTLATEFFIGETYDIIPRYLNMDLDEVGIWNRSLNQSDVTQLYNNGNGITFPMAPTITLNSPIDTFNSTNQTIVFNGTVTSATLANVSLIIDGIFNETNSSGIEGDYIFTKTISNGDHNWTYEACDTTGCANATVRTFKIGFIENSQTFNASSFETDEETFTINITTNGTTPTNGKLIYNGTTFSSVTITNTANNDFDITKTIDIPLVAGTKEWFFNFTLGATESSSSTQNQIINLTNFTFCSTPVSYFNVSFKNETLAEESVTAQINANWNFWLGGGTTVKTLVHTNTTENADYSFCLNDPINKTLETNVSIIYDNSISEQRNFFKSYTLTNVTTNQTLFLLPTADGLFVTFQTVTVAEQIISGVSANATKSGDLIEVGLTDDAGLITFFLDPDTTYTFNFFKTGFDLVTTSLKPTQTSFTITMGSEVIQEENDTTKGISYIINPISSTLSNDTETEFNLSFFSTFWALDNFGFALKNSTGNIFNVTSSTSTGGFLSQILNTEDNNDIIMEIFWTIGGNQTNITRTWLVFDDADEGFSIKTFFDDLSTYLTSGMFGLTDFGLGIIIFGIILIVTGILSARFGNIITNPPGISLIIFSLVLFFDVGLGIMPNPVGAVPNFPSIFVGLIFLGTLLKEGIK